MGKKLLKIHRVDFNDAEMKFQWFTIVTIPGHERKVADMLRSRFQNMAAADKLKEVFTPIKEWEEEVVSTRRKKDGTYSKRKVKKSEYILEPGYIFINMIMTNDTWNIVRQTSGVAGWLKNADGQPGDVPVEDILKWKEAMGEGKELKAQIAKDFGGKPGDKVRITDGPFKGYEGRVVDVQELNISIEVDPNGMKMDISPLVLEVI